MDYTPLGRSGLDVNRICLGTMTFGEQVDEATAHRILDRSLELAWISSTPPRCTRCPLGARPTAPPKPSSAAGSPPAPARARRSCSRARWPARRAAWDWVRGGKADLTADDIRQACDDSLTRLRTDVIDLYQIHWPVRNVPAFGNIYFDPEKERVTSSIREQLAALAGLVKAGKVRAVGLSNETPWGVSEFVKLAEQHGLPRIASVQNPYCLVNRVVDNGLDEVLWREEVGLLAYSPLGFGTLTGKYDEVGFDATRPELGRIARFESMRKQRWGRPETLAAAKRYNALAKQHGLTPAQLALAFCYRSWRVASTIIGVTSVSQLEECVAAWRVQLSPELLAECDKIRWDLRDPAQ